MTPNLDSRMEATTTIEKKSRKRKKEAQIITTSQIWQRNGSCPKGTIPVRRIRKRDMLRADSIEVYGRKKPGVWHRPTQLDANKNSYLQQINRSVCFSTNYK